jgi:hypothetical protein
MGTPHRQTPCVPAWGRLKTDRIGTCMGTAPSTDCTCTCMRGGQHMDRRKCQLQPHCPSPEGGLPSVILGQAHERATLHVRARMPRPPAFQAAAKRKKRACRDRLGRAGEGAAAPGARGAAHPQHLPKQLHLFVEEHEAGAKAAGPAHDQRLVGVVARPLARGPPRSQQLQRLLPAQAMPCRDAKPALRVATEGSPSCGDDQRKAGDKNVRSCCIDGGMQRTLKG